MEKVEHARVRKPTWLLGFNDPLQKDINKTENDFSEKSTQFRWTAPEFENAALFIFNTDFQMRCAEMHLAAMSEYTQ